MSYRGFRSKEDCERRQWYLVRQLFENPPLLSPIQEENEPREPPDSPDSLPELIVEVIPRRPDNDETKEFYEKLEREVRDFLNLSREDYRSSIDDGLAIVYEDSEKSSSTEYNTSTTYKILNLNENDAEKPENISFSSEKSNCNKSYSENHQDLDNEEDASVADSLQESPRTPEIIRSEQRVSRSRLSAICEYTSKDSSVSDNPSCINFEASEMSIQSSIKPFDRSTPIPSSGEKRKLHTSTPGRKKKSRMIQTSFSSTSEEDIWKNFFVGKQTVYKLCSC